MPLATRDWLLATCYNGVPMMESDKIMFEIYREAPYTGQYRVVYFTELNDQNKEYEINRAMAGEHYYDGFIKNYLKDEAKDIIDGILKRLNNGEKITPKQLEAALGSHIPQPAKR
ncbi:MAG TPA: hypothetical protein VE825_13995 [Terriglobales bacterium]|nr:hypothetical protein [Terriglobales bacterium]